ncbi:MAG: hypothetical protein K2W82_14260 [Candidatus Obscuribacterales bacterium]|nr:hypothetical protein [Candidatus Obscuribacterales bacterium]
MLDKLAEITAQLPGMLEQAEIWKSLNIDYHPPVVERLYTQVGDLRVSLHCIHPCQSSEALFHPHPWPSAVLILNGGYEMGMAYGKGLVVPPCPGKLILGAGSRYEMTDPDGWHYVRPLAEPSYSVMISGKPWDREMPASPEHPLKPLSDERIAELLAQFKKLLKGINHGG